MLPTSKTLAAGLLLAALAFAATPASQDPARLSIGPANTRVGIAKVKLQVDNLQVDRDSISGTYDLRIPLAPVLNDRGTIQFELDSPMTQTALNGGRVTGRCFSVLDGRERPVVCEFDPAGWVVIRVDTGKRILTFRTRYEWV